MMRRLCLLAFIAGSVAMTLAGWPALASFRDSAAGPVTISVGTFGTVSATVDIDPDALNPDCQGKYVMAYVELPDRYDVADIDVPTAQLCLNDACINAQEHPTAIGDQDEDGIPDMMVKFSRRAVVALLEGRTGDITFRVRGEISGTTFEGTDTTEVLDSHGVGEDTELDLPEEDPEEGSVPPSARPPLSLIPSTNYEVKPGDTLWGIATRFGTTVQTLAELNGLENPATILYGSTLKVPYLGEDPESNLLEEGLKEGGMPPSTRALLPIIPTTEYTVQPGDTLWDIARRFGTTIQVLVELNSLENRAAILYGSTLNVPYVPEEPGNSTPALSP